MSPDREQSQDERSAESEPAAGRPTPTAEPAWRRRRRLDAAFGDVLPETTGDERSGGERERRSGEDWLREQVPPHHGAS